MQPKNSQTLAELAQQLTKVVCVGRNYAAHAAELNNPVPDEPVLFIKPSSAVVPWSKQVAIPCDRGECHHELELAFLIGQRLTKASRDDCLNAIAGVTLALDLTLREEQSKLKQQGKPWELAKAFDGACPIAAWEPLDNILSCSKGEANSSDLDLSCLAEVSIELKVNDKLCQAGQVRDMIWQPLDLIAHISQFFTLNPGDVVLTGTPAGVSSMELGDKLSASLNGQVVIESEVVYA
ncbi:MAG: fumarylacetoacetate hydrolase family protein [Gammaproteobacteria bacterium]|nr:fumarylacetoacetate hydrolase family protein [Gammaproteobacteria bacterium]